METVTAETGLINQQKDFNLSVDYSEEAKEKQLIKFTLSEDNKTGGFEIEADALLGLLANYYKKDLAIALSTTSMDTIFMVEAERTLYAKTTKTMKKGEVITFSYKHPYPYVLAALEEAYGIAKIAGDVVSIPKETYTEVLASMPESNKEFIKKYYQINDEKKTEELPVEPSADKTA